MFVNLNIITKGNSLFLFEKKPASGFYNTSKEQGHVAAAPIGQKPTLRMGIVYRKNATNPITKNLATRRSRID